MTEKDIKIVELRVNGRQAAEQLWELKKRVKELEEQKNCTNSLVGAVLTLEVLYSTKIVRTRLFLFARLVVARLLVLATLVTAATLLARFLVFLLAALFVFFLAALLVVFLAARFLFVSLLHVLCSSVEAESEQSNECEALSH